MIQARVFETASDASSITAYLVLQDDSGDGIRQALVYDDTGTRYGPFEPNTPCDRILEFELGPIARTRLPLWVEAFDCGGRTTPREENGPLLTPLPLEPGLPVRCSPEVMCPPATGCGVAVADTAAAAAELSDVCEECEGLRKRLSSKEAEAIGFFIASMVAAVLAAIFLALGSWFSLAGVALAIAAAGLLVAFHEASNAANRLRSQAEECEAQLEQLRDNYDSGLQRIGSHCCEACMIGAPLSPAC
ncbi:hypothetical protein [Microbulbifer discodermiae]|uniref:hypothetical protein n=1 Tax=Microbulbifer sp. 2201CG32-9 TaxID=3232309 RepID=UPI00345C4BB3